MGFNDEFVKFFAYKVYSGSLTQTVKDKFKPLAKKAFALYINDKLGEILKSAISTNQAAVKDEPSQPAENKEQPALIVTPEKLIETTDDEKEAYFIIKSILRTTVDPNKINIRDAQTYCAVLYDDNNRKPICRLYFNNPARKQIGFFLPDKTEEKTPLEKLDDLYKFTDKLITGVKSYTQPTVISPIS